MMSTKGQDASTVFSGNYLRHPVVAAAGAASLLALIGLNVAAFIEGLSAPWLLGAVIIADILVVGITIFVAARQVLMAEQRSEATEARLASIMDSAMDAIITMDDLQNIMLFNHAAEQIFRCPRSEAIGQSLDRFIPQRFRAAHRAYVEQFGELGVTSRKMGSAATLWALRADGEEFPIDASISQVVESGRRYFTVILRDITLRKQREDEIKRSQQELRDLSARVIEAREEEKTRIARELHDELGQLLTALKMDLSSLCEHFPANSSELAAKAEEMAAILDQTISSTRRITTDLRPLMLDDLGLADAANWLVDDFAKRSGVICQMQLVGPEALESTSKSVSTTVYRALQESLTNIARHSGATNAWVLLEADDNLVQVEVEDNGRGIAPADLAKSRSLGLRSMRERVDYLGGAFEVACAPRGGTRITLRVPSRAAVDGASR